ncbi:MFS family permease [Variovorax sp. W2I14]
MTTTSSISPQGAQPVPNTSGNGAGPSQSGNADHSHIAPGEIAVGVVIGRASEYFDFFVYGIASVLVFPYVFFPFEQRLEGILYAFVVFSFAFIARPFGTVISMAIQRRFGRETKLTIALFLLGTSTAGIAFLPGYESLGFTAIVLLSVFRFCQGLALGGSWDGLPSLLALNAPPNRRGWYAMLGQLGAPIGFFIASALFAYLYASLSIKEFLDWGWRYTFYVAFAINVVALFARLRLVATEEYSRLLEERELQPTSVVELTRSQGANLLIGAFAALASYALFHLITVFPLSWITLYSDQSITEFLVVQMIGAVFCAGGIVASGLIADRVGRRFTLGGLAALIAVFSGFAPTLLDGGPHRAGRLHPAGLRAAGPFVWPGRGRRDLEFRTQVPLHRRGPHGRPGLADRRCVRTAGGAGAVGELRSGVCQRLPALRRGGHAGGAGIEPGTRARLRRCE